MKMTKEELKEKHPQLYMEVRREGILKRERERVSNLSALKNIPGVSDSEIVEAAIQNGVSFSETVTNMLNDKEITKHWGNYHGNIS